MKKLIVIAFALSFCTMAFAKDKDAAKAPKEQTVTGWVSDSKCAANGAKAGHEDCAKKCIEGGQSMVLVNDKDQSVWTVKNPEALKGHEGHHVKVSAHVYPEDKSVHIMKVSMMKDQGKKGEEHSEHK